LHLSRLESSAGLSSCSTKHPHQSESTGQFIDTRVWLIMLVNKGWPADYTTIPNTYLAKKLQKEMRTTMHRRGVDGRCTHIHIFDFQVFDLDKVRVFNFNDTLCSLLFLQVTRIQQKWVFFRWHGGHLINIACNNKM